MNTQLFVLLTQLKLNAVKLASIVLSFFLPIWGIVLMIGFAIGLDTITGIWKSIKNGEGVTSRRLSGFISKTFLYESTILLFFMLDKFILNDIVITFFSVPLLTTKIVALVLFSVEIVSINENYKAVKGIDLWSAFKSLVSRIKDIKKDVTTINEKTN